MEMLGAAEDFATLLALFSALPEGTRVEALERFLDRWEEIRARAGYPKSERLLRVRRFIQNRVRGDT